MDTKEVNKTILHLSEPSLRNDIADLCKKLLQREIVYKPVVYMKQPKEMKKCWLSLYKQLLSGLEKVETKYVGICEHDCIYSHEHLNWIPPRDDTYYYNDNCWLLQWHGTRPNLEMQYSYWPKRLALSQLVCSKDLLYKQTKERLDFLGGKVPLAGEFGALYIKLKDRAKSGSPAYLKEMDRYIETQPKHETFKTKIPNIDIRHDSNFTGPRRGNKRRYELPYWGKFNKLIEEASNDFRKSSRQRD